ncbi:MAG: ferritin-like domain-containing protein [Clostridiales bacterium]|nr:ferritin-like domain-containing protein [Clostridiales bacterium]
MELSDIEKKILEDQLRAEYICINKYKLYTEQATDPQIKNVFNLVYEQEVNHANSLKSLLEKGGFNPPTPAF